MNELTTDPLTREQRARAEGLHTASAVLVAAPAQVADAATPPDLVDLAAYVIDGVHPLTRYENGADQ